MDLDPVFPLALLSRSPFPIRLEWCGWNVGKLPSPNDEGREGGLTAYLSAIFDDIAAKT